MQLGIVYHEMILQLKLKINHRNDVVILSTSGGFFFFNCARGTEWHSQKFLKHIKVSCLNSPPPSFSFIYLLPHSWNSINRSQIFIYIHLYMVFALYSPNLFWLVKLLFCYLSLESSQVFSGLETRMNKAF
jgi:hypothetical protein